MATRAAPAPDVVGILPIQDPSQLTTQQLIREIGNLREILETRLDGMDRAINLLQTLTDKIPMAVDEKIEALKEIHEEKFFSVQTQFRERDVRTEQSSKDSKVAVDAALQAAKEAVGEQNKSSALAIAKSEASTVKQIDQQAALIQQVTKAVDDKFNDIKERLTRIEGKDEGAVKHKVETSNSNTFIVSLVVGVCGILFGVVAMVIPFLKH